MKPIAFVPFLPLLALSVGCELTPDRSPCADFDCSGHGTCVMLEADDGEPAPTCLCDAGYAPTPSGWLCVPATDTSLCAGVTCSGHGTCVSVAGQATCSCEAGYSASSDGTRCIDPCAGVTCSGHGTCQRTGESALCACDSGYAPSADGTSCEATGPQTYLSYAVTRNTSHGAYVVGYASMSMDSDTGPIQEKVGYSQFYGWGGQSLSRKTRLTLTLDAKGEQISALQWDDHFRQGQVTRLRHGQATVDAQGLTVTFQRLDRQVTVTLPFTGAEPPLPMLGGNEYPGWTVGCFSPAFYWLALKRYDATQPDPQYIEVFWPSLATVSRVRVEADSTATPTKPVLRFPDYQTKVIYDDKGYPESIVLESQGLACSYQAGGAPADLNLAELPGATTFTPTPLPTAGQDSSVAITSSDGTQLAGTLTLPLAASGPSPAVLMVTDPLALDRDAPLYTLPQPLFKHLAAHLAQAGYASLRYDPRGRGQSQGDLDQLTLPQVVDDADAAHAALAQSSGVDAARIFVLSHGTAGVVAASLLAPQRKGSSIKGYLALAPVVTDVDQAALYHATAHLTASGFSDKFVNDEKQYYTDAFDAITQGTYTEDSFGKLPVSLWQGLLAFDGTTLIGAFPGPVLALGGDQDLDFSPEQLQAIQDAATRAIKTNVTVTTLTGLTAMFVADDKTTLIELAPLPLDLPQALLSPVINWLDANK